MSKQTPKAAQATLPGAELPVAQAGQVDQAEADRLAAEKAEADRLAAEQAHATVLMLRRDAIDGTWYPAGAVLHGVPRTLVQTLKGDGCIDDDQATVEIALQAGAQLLRYVPTAEPEAQVDA